jgi:hypothetical protein
MDSGSGVYHRAGPGSPGNGPRSRISPRAGFHVITSPDRLEKFQLDERLRFRLRCDARSPAPGMAVANCSPGLRKYSNLHRLSSPPASAKATRSPVSSLFRQTRLLPLTLLKANRQRRHGIGASGAGLRRSVNSHFAAARGESGFQRGAGNSRHEGSVSGFEIRRGYPVSPRGQANRALPRLSSAQNPGRTAPPRENHRAFPDRWLGRLRPEARRMSLARLQEPPR